MRRLRPALLALLALLALSPLVALAACISAPDATPVAAGTGAATVNPIAGATSGNVRISASGTRFEQSSVDVPAGEPFTIDFDNKDAGMPHDIVIHSGDAAGPVVFAGDVVTGPMVKTYDVPALQAGTYTFVCSIHPGPMVGTMTAR